MAAQLKLRVVCLAERVRDLCVADFRWAMRSAAVDDVDTFAYNVAYATLFVSEAKAIDPNVGHAQEDLMRIAGAMRALMAVRAAAVSRVENVEVAVSETVIDLDADSSDPDL